MNHLWRLVRKITSLYWDANKIAACTSYIALWIPCALIISFWRVSLFPLQVVTLRVLLPPYCVAACCERHALGQGLFLESGLSNAQLFENLSLWDWLTIYFPFFLFGSRQRLRDLQIVYHFLVWASLSHIEFVLVNVHKTSKIAKSTDFDGLGDSFWPHFPHIFHRLERSFQLWSHVTFPPWSAITTWVCRASWYSVMQQKWPRSLFERHQLGALKMTHFLELIGCAFLVISLNETCIKTRSNYWYSWLLEFLFQIGEGNCILATWFTFTDFNASKLSCQCTSSKDLSRSTVKGTAAPEISSYCKLCSWAKPFAQSRSSFELQHTLGQLIPTGGFLKWGVSQNGWFIREILSKRMI